MRCRRCCRHRRQHARQDGAGDQEHAFHVHCHHPVPLFFAGVQKGQGREDAGVVHQHGNVPEGLLYSRHCRLHLLCVRHIGRRENNVVACIAQCPGYLGALAVWQVDNAHPSPFSCKQLRCSQPAAPAPPVISAILPLRRPAMFDSRCLLLICSCSPGVSRFAWRSMKQNNGNIHIPMGIRAAG